MPNSVSDAASHDTVNRLEHFPVPFFAIVMGLMGLALALHAAEPVLAWSGGLSNAVRMTGIAIFCAIAFIYGLKLMRYPGAVAAEWKHPVRLAFFPAITISLLLMATALMGTAPDIARVVWTVGAAGQGMLTVAVVSGWISHRAFEMGHLTPAWFIPAVGNVVVPIAGVRLGHPEISWLFFSGGLIFWVVLLTLVFNRLIFHNPIPARLFPTMVILIAPPAVAYLAYVQLVGGVDPFARFLLNTGYVFALLVLVQVPKLLRLPFALSWWALSFPVAGLSIASLRYGGTVGSGGHQMIGVALLAVLCVAIAGLVLRTLVAIARGEICQPE